ncbi:alpha/beta hydrolase [Streptomyces sp. NPDC101209]|uniref:alpha/beta hydrolase n=1 Tax=Streptomyces sp. NPDC101209 TaxID=3366129 RepID=UPI0037FBB998
MSHPHRPAAVSRRTVAKAAAVTGLAALFGAATGTARAATRLTARTFDVPVPSAALGRTAPVRLILPSGFDAQPGRTYPVLYLLHGAHDDYTSWTRETDIEAFTEGRNLIVAMPDAGPTGIPTAWRGGPDYETFQLSEVPALLARDYRASAVRAVAGVSTGGYGAMAHAARHPGVFTAAASYSGIRGAAEVVIAPCVERAAGLSRDGLVPGAGQAGLYEVAFAVKELLAATSPPSKKPTLLSRKARGTEPSSNRAPSTAWLVSRKSLTRTNAGLRGGRGERSAGQQRRQGVRARGLGSCSSAACSATTRMHGQTAGARGTPSVPRLTKTHLPPTQ